MAIGTAALRPPESLRRWWAGKSRAERRVVLALAALVAAALAWLVVWQPLLRDIAALRVAVPAERAALAAAQQTVDTMAGFARNPAARAAGEPRAELDRLLREQGLRAAVTQLDWQESRARLVFAAVSVDALVGLLEAAQRDAQLRIVEATLTARVEPGSVRADLVLAR